MKHLVLVIMVLIIAGPTSAQTGDLRGDLDIIYNDLDRLKSRQPYGKIEGSPFLFDSWQTASVSLSNKRHLNEVKINLDLFGNKVILLRNEHEIEIDAKSVEQIQISNNKSTLLIKTNVILNKETDRFYLILASGEKVVLAKELKVVLKSGDDFGAQAQFVADHEYYLISSTQFRKVGTTRKAISKWFFEYEEEMKRFVDSYKGNLKMDSSLALIVNHYNELYN
ncbi:MAG: hypothetical protein ABL895_18080 [Cyclobacteriaceae bacterium]